MSKAQRRITEKPREYEGEKEAERLVNWLNTTSDDAGKTRIVCIITTFVQLAQHKVANPPNTRRGDDGYYYETVTLETKRRDKLQCELDRALRYYTMTPAVAFIAGGKGYSPWTLVRWIPIRGSKLDHNVRRHLPPWSSWQSGDNPLPGEQIAESGAVKSALELIESGLVFRLKVCRCGKFFYQRFSHQKFCTSKCRLAEFRDSEESRKKRNDYARKLYQLHKKLDSGKNEIGGRNVHLQAR